MYKRKVFAVYSRLGMLTVLAVISFLLALRFFGNPSIAPSGFYNAGVDVMGIFACVVLCFGCIGKEEARLEESTYWLIGLIVLIGLSFFNNICSWYVMGVPEYRFWYLIMNELTKIFDFGLVYLFYNYVRKTMDFKGKLEDFMDKVSWMAMMPFVLLVILNTFFPICFSVDELGVFHMERFYRLVDLYLVIIAPPTAVLIIQSKTSRKAKTTAMSFIFIPILHYLIAGGAHGYATQYGSTLIAVILIYTVLFAERSNRLASTQTELEMAMQIQNSMVPSIFPAFPERKEFDIYASMDPAREVGGDFYDFFLIDDDHLGIVMADVSGKGIPAALFMMASKIILQSCAMLGKSAAETLAKTNEAICSNNEAQMFVTIWFGILEISTGRLKACNAGHEYPAILRNGRFELLKDNHGFVVGAMEESKYSEYELQLEPGDKLFLYTDGVPEATDRDKNLFGTERMLEALNKNSDSSSKAILGNVKQAIDEFVNDEEQFDDLTMLCLEYLGK